MKQITIEEMYGLHYKDLWDEEVKDSLAEPFQEYSRSYIQNESITRKVLEIESMHTNDIENMVDVLNLDPRCLTPRQGGYIIPKRGSVPAFTVHPDNDYGFELATNPVIKWDEATKPITDPIESVPLKAARGIVATEHIELAKLLDKAVTEKNTMEVVGMTLDDFSNLVTFIQGKFEVKNIIMNDKTNTDLSKNWKHPDGRKELLKFATICKAQVHTAPEFKEEVIYLCGTPKDVGIFSIAYDIHCLTAHDAHKLRFGWVFAEKIGIFIKQNALIQKIVILK